MARYGRGTFDSFGRRCCRRCTEWVSPERRTKNSNINKLSKSQKTRSQNSNFARPSKPAASQHTWAVGLPRPTYRHRQRERRQIVLRERTPPLIRLTHQVQPIREQTLPLTATSHARTATKARRTITAMLSLISIKGILMSVTATPRIRHAHSLMSSLAMPYWLHDQRARPSTITATARRTITATAGVRRTIIATPSVLAPPAPWTASPRPSRRMRHPLQRRLQLAPPRHTLSVPLPCC